MGFLEPEPPPFDLEEWKRKPHLSRLKPLIQDWAISGSGIPGSIYVIYALKFAVFTLGAFALISVTTPGLGGLGSIESWWTEPVVFQKLVVWTLLWEILGLGSGSLPLTYRFVPPIGGVLYWLRPGMVRLPPWPEKVPFTRGSTRTLLDVALYAGVLAAAVYLLLSDGEATGGGVRLEPEALALLLGIWALLGLRDKVSFLAGRPEIYGLMCLVGLFPVAEAIVGWQIAFVCIWWGAASSKLNRHFPFVVSVMISNTPWNRSRRAKRELWADHPEDCRPSRVSAAAAHLGTVMEFALPFLLLVTSGGWLGAVAVIGMLIFHLHIASTFPLGVPVEWNIFMLFGILFLFGHHGDVPLSNLDDPLLIAALLLVGVLIPVIGNLRPDLISFLPSMRYYAGNWATSVWLFSKDAGAEERLDECVKKVAPSVVAQLTRIYDRETADYMMQKGLAFRAMHSHGRALNALLARAVGDVERYWVRDGEMVSGIVNGWNFGDGHFHDHRLLEIVQERCGYGEGELRVITLESQPIQVQRQRYRIYDAATGLREEGYVDVADMVARGPWLEETYDFPLEVTRPPERTAEPAPVA